MVGNMKKTTQHKAGKTRKVAIRAMMALRKRDKEIAAIEAANALLPEEPRTPPSGYPVIIRREVAPNIIQLTLKNRYRWYILKATKKAFHVVPSTSYVVDCTVPKGKFHENWLLQHSFEDAAAILNEAATRGTRLHAAVCHAILHSNLDFDFQKNPYTFLEGRPFTTREYEQMICFEKFWKTLRPVAQKIEQPFVNVELGYGGTFDFHGFIDEGALLSFDARKKENGVNFSGKTVSIVWDWKFGNHIYDSHMYQASAYAEAVQADYYGVVHLGTKTKNGFKIWFAKRGDPDEPHFEIFKHCLALFNLAHGKERPEIVSMGSTISLE